MELLSDAFLILPFFFVTGNLRDAIYVSDSAFLPSPTISCAMMVF